LVANIHRGQRYDVYVGRPSGSRPGPWGNPFVLGKDGNREQVIALYREWLPQQAELMRRLPELKGKVLGCFCAPLPCHADVLAELANHGMERDALRAAGQTSLFDEPARHGGYEEGR
jgi:hypothetical protein